jgi:hypothetical protein
LANGIIPDVIDPLAASGFPVIQKIARRYAKRPKLLRNVASPTDPARRQSVPAVLFKEQMHAPLRTADVD